MSRGNLPNKLSSHWARHYARSTSAKKAFLPNLYQPIFVVFIIFIAFFARDNPYLVYPQIIYLLVLFLASNFVTNYLFSTRDIRLWVVDLLVTWNCFIITGIVYYSGGIHSYLWVLYLLPVFTAAIWLEKRQLAWTTFLGIFMHAMFYGNPFRNWDYDVVFEVASKSSLLFLGAMLMHSLVAEKSKVESVLEDEREKLDKMSSEVAQHSLQMVKSAGIIEVGKRTSSILHDMSTPVSVILGSARILELEPQFAVNGDLKRIIDAALLCKNMIANTMQIAKGQEYKFEIVDLRDPLESATAVTAPLLLERKVELRKNYKGQPLKLRGSFVHLERLFLNLIMNSAGAMSGGGHITVSALLASNGDWIEASVEDSGPGFPENLIKSGPQLFASTKKQGEGTGLGLVTSKEIVEKHGGMFQLANRSKGGAVIKVLFPIAK